MTTETRGLEFKEKTQKKFKNIGEVWPWGRYTS